MDPIREIRVGVRWHSTKDSVRDRSRRTTIWNRPAVQAADRYSGNACGTTRVEDFP
jgi:hypothetical protein